MAAEQLFTRFQEKGQFFQAWGKVGQKENYRLIIDCLMNLPLLYWASEITGDEPRDSSAAAIAACGMLEMSKYLSEEEAKKYTELAEKIAVTLAANYAVQDGKQSNGLLLHGVYAKSSPYNPISKEEERGVDECVIWGDYFYMELLTRLSKDWGLYW